MDEVLSKRLHQLSYQADLLEQAEGEFRLQEAKKDTVKGDLFLVTEASSVAERNAKVQASPDYLEFMKELARLETKYNHEKRRFSILEKVYLAEHATFTRSATLINRQGVIT